MKSQDELQQQLMQLRQDSEALREGLSNVVAQLEESGHVPSQQTIDQQRAFRRQFLSLRSALAEYAQSFDDDSSVSMDQINSLSDIDHWLRKTSKVAEQRDASEIERRQALEVLAQIETFTHLSKPDFSALKDYQEAARQLTTIIQSAHWRNLPPVV